MRLRAAPTSRMTFAVLATAAGAYSLIQSLVVPVLPTIQAGFHTSQTTVTWVLTAYLLSASIATPIIGRLGDIFGKQRMLVASLATLAVGAVVAAVAPSILVLIAARVIQGVGGGVLPLSFGIVRDEFATREVPGKVGAIASLTAAGGGLGIVVAGPIVRALGVHWLFWIPSVVLVAAAWGAKYYVPPSKVRAGGRFNWPAGILMSGWLVPLVLGISQAPSWGWSSPSVALLLAASVVVFVLWVAVELRARYPLVDMRMMSLPAVWTTNVVALLLGVGMYSSFAFLPEFLQTPHSTGYGLGLSVTYSGLTILPSTATMFFVGLYSGRLTYRYGSKLVLVVGLVISIAPYVMLVAAHAQVWEVVVAVVIQGVGMGLAFSALSSLVVSAVPEHQTGVASGMNANIRTIGGSVGAALVSTIVASGGLPHGYPLESGYSHAFALLAATSAASVVAAAAIPRLARSGRGEPDDRTAPVGDLLMAGLPVADEPAL